MCCTDLRGTPMKSRSLPLFGAATAVFFATTAHVQADEPIEEIVVTAEPLNRTADQLTQATQVLEAEELLTRANASIGETLANEPGMSSTYFGPVAGRPVIRGQEGSRVSVLDGGTSTLDAADLSPDHAVPVEPLFAERIEIIRGAGTLLYGSSAAGGVVNVVDARIPQRALESPVAGAVELRGDTASEERAIAGRLDGAVGGLNWHLDGFDRQNEDIEINGFATADADERAEDEVKGRVLNSEGDAKGGAAGLSFIGERGFIGAAVSRYETTYGLPGPEHEEGDEEEGQEEEGADEALIAPGPFIELEQTRIDAEGKYQLDGFLESMRFKFAHNDYEHQEIEPTGEVATTFKNDAWEGRVELVHGERDGVHGAVGVQITDRDFSAVGAEAFIPATRSNTWGVFVLEQIELGRGHLEFGGRVERTEHDPEGGLEKFEATAISAAVGINWGLAEDYHVSANLARTERNPNLEELYSNGAHLATGLFEVGLLAEGDGDVKDEVGVNLDTALHYHADALSWKAGVFYNHITDYIFRFETILEEEGLPLTPYLQDDADFYGVEAELSWLIGDVVDVRVFGDYVRGKTDDDDLPRIQPMRLGAGMTYDGQNWSAGVDAIWHAQQDDIASFRTDSFLMLNAHVTFHIETAGGIGADVFLKGTNLLDEDARRSTSFKAAYVPLPGAGLQLGVRARFN